MVQIEDLPKPQILAFLFCIQQTVRIWLTIGIKPTATKEIQVTNMGIKP